MHNTATNNRTATAANGISQLGDANTLSLEVIVKLLAAATVAFISLAGNIAVILVVVKTKRMRTNTFFLIVNMSISDLLYTVIAMPPFTMSILRYGMSVGGTMGALICKVVNAAAFGLMACSVLTLTTISFDRFFAIVFPFKKVNITRYLKAIITCIWLGALLVMSPLLYATRLGNRGSFYFCYEDWSLLLNTEQSSRAYTVALFIVLYVVPFITMSILYSWASFVLWFRKMPGNSDTSSRQAAALHYRPNVIRMLVTIVFCFVLCWLPIQIASFTVFFSDSVLPSQFLFLSEFLIRANGALNPIIYVAFNRTFRRGFKLLMLASCHVNQSLRRQINAAPRAESSNITTNVSFRRKIIRETEV